MGERVRGAFTPTREEYRPEYSSATGIWRILIVPRALNHRYLIKIEIGYIMVKLLTSFFLSKKDTKL